MMDSERFKALAEKYMSGTLSETEGAELLQALESSPELRASLCSQAAMHALLGRRYCKTDSAVGRRVQAALRDPTQKKGVITRIMEKLPERPQKKTPQPEPPPRIEFVPPSRAPRRAFLYYSAAAALVVIS